MHLRTRLAIQVLLFALPLILCAQRLVPPIENFRPFQYGAASKNWDISSNSEGEIFIANNSGLLHYDGESWNLNKLPNSTIIRSVATQGDKIFTGSYEEFGFWEKGLTGELEYTSLTHLIQNHTFTSEEFWEILPMEDRIAFRSFSTLYYYKDEKITVIELPFFVSDIIEYEGRLLVASSYSGLYELAEDKAVAIDTGGAWENTTITDMAVTPSGLMLGTKLRGCFLLQGEKLVPWNSSISSSLKTHQLNKMITLENGNMIFGTIKNGVYLYDWQKDRYTEINKEAGLQNNTILGLLQFQDQLWVGEDIGVDRIHLDSPLLFYTDTSGALGSVYDVAQYDSTLYLGSNTGVFYFEQDKLKFIEGSQGHVWDLQQVEDELLSGHNMGTFLVAPASFINISKITGGYKMIRIPERVESFLQGTYTGLAYFEKNENDGWQVKQIQGIDFPVRYLCFEDEFTLWVAHAYKGIYRVKLDKTFSKVLSLQGIDKEELPHQYNVKLYNIKNQIVLQSKGNWYKYEPIAGKITEFEQFKPYNGHNLLYQEGDAYWFSQHETGARVTYTNLDTIAMLLDYGPLVRRLVPDAEKMVRKNDSVYLLTLTDGFAELNLEKMISGIGAYSVPVPALSAIRDRNGSLSVRETSWNLSYKSSREIRLHVAAPGTLKADYTYDLQGPSAQEGKVSDGQITLQNLAHGDYRLSVRTLGLANQVSEPLWLSFSISPPWYLSWWGYLLYFMVLLLIIFTVRRYNRFKLDKKHRLLKDRMQREQEKIRALEEKDKLAEEVKIKQKELARTTMNVAKKNKLILELKNLLYMNKGKFDNQQRYRSYMKKLDSAINDDEDWQRFEVNFKELHNDFFEMLLSRYPNLTPKDLKLCAYLKMNLSTKEIAPLMGITIRGVEIHRYRLRKKLNLDSQVNISNFLITLK